MATAKPTEEVIWRPQSGPQKALIDCPLSEIFYGGARGGGKTDGVLGKYALKSKVYGDGFNAVFFRKELPMLDDAIERSAELYGSLGAKWNDQKKTWRFRWGGRLRFRPLERVSDADKYQGQNISDACVEEAGQYADSTPIDRLNGVLRSAKGVPTQLILTGNPGGRGQLWIKRRYIDPAPNGMKVLTRDLPGGRKHRFVFIPSKVQNNKILLANDPDYINRLYLVGSQDLVDAWLKGDWNAIEGAFFDCWDSDRHVIEPFPIPTGWPRIRAFDWGSAKPFSYGEYAISDGSHLPRGCLVKYYEWYGAKKDAYGLSIPDTGLKLEAEAVAKGIAESCKARGLISHGERCSFSRSVADPSIFSEDGGPSIAHRMNDNVVWSRADNARVARVGHIGGWDQMRGRLKGTDDGPMLVFFNTCADAVRTIPTLQHDDLNAEDLDTHSEDHEADEIRYACMSRPWQPPIPDKAKPEDRWAQAFENDDNDSWKTA